MIQDGKNGVAENQGNESVVALNPVLDVDGWEEFEILGDEAGDSTFPTSGLSYDINDQYAAEDVNENRNPDQGQLARPLAVDAADPERDCQEDDEALHDHRAFYHRYQESNHEEPETQEKTLGDIEGECRRVGSLSVAKHVGNVGGVPE